MKAVVCHAPGSIEDLVVEAIDAPRAGKGDVIIDVAAAGINYLDVLMAEGRYQTKPEPPFVPGSEVSGRICEVGEGVEGLAVGMRVASLCRVGGFAQKVRAAAANCFAIPDSVTDADAAAFPIVYGTSWLGLHDRAQLKRGETLLVLGAAGGVGLTAVELGKALGARVIAAASSAEKRALATQYGADDVLDYADGDLRGKVRALTGGKGVDVVYDPVGGALGEQAFKSLAWMGRHLVVGFASGPMPKFPTNYFLLKSSSALGVYWGETVARDPAGQGRAMAELFARLARGELRPHIGGQYPLDEALTALRTVKHREARGKVILNVGAGT